MLSMQVKSPQSPKGLLQNPGISKPDPNPVFYREVDLSDFPHDIPRTLKLDSFFNRPVPRDSMPRSSSTVWTLNDVASQ